MSKKIGNQTTPTYQYNYYGANVSNMMAVKVTMGEGGAITSVSCYVAGKNGGGNVTFRFVVYSSNGDLLAQTADLTIGAGSGTAGGQSWQTGNLTSALTVTNNEVLYIGWWRHAAQSDEWTEGYSGSDPGTEYQHTDGSNTAPPNSLSWNSTGGYPGIYATYTPAPTISGFSPSVGASGSSVTITGTYFTGATAVSFNGTSASFSVTDDSHISATVPAGATTGTISVTTPGGTATSSSSFTVSQAEADNGSAWVSGITIEADNGSSWVTGVTVWADNGTSWVQIG